jgi:hypothetical protein
MIEEQNGKTEEEIKTEVVAKAKRRQHSAKYKLCILREVDACKGTDEVGALWEYHRRAIPQYFDLHRHFNWLDRHHRTATPFPRVRL